MPARPCADLVGQGAPRGSALDGSQPYFAKGLGPQLGPVPASARRHQTANSLKLLADAKGFEPPTSASGGDGTKSRKQGYPAFYGAKSIRPSAARRSWMHRNAIKPGTVPGSFRLPSSCPRLVAHPQGRMSTRHEGMTRVSPSRNVIKVSQVRCTPPIQSSIPFSRT